MSKKIKKIAKVAAKVVTVGASGSDGWGSKAVGALSGGLVGDSSVYGETGGLKGILGGAAPVVDNGAAAATDNLAKTQMQIATQQAQQASAEAVEQARASANAIQLANDRSAAQAAADQLKPVDQAEADVQLGGKADSATARRKKFNTASVGAGQGGPAIRI
jgi:hypothetical protein